MTSGQLRSINVIGLVVFAIVLTIAILRSPIELARLDWRWLFLGGFMSGLALCFQAAQNMVFLSSANLRPDWRWSLWFTAEKAWVNTVLPIKAGTAGAVIYLRKMLDLSWHSYLKFMLVCGGFTISASVAGATFLLWPGINGALVSILGFIGCSAAIGSIYPLKLGQIIWLVLLTLLTLAALTFGVGAALLGLGHGQDLTSIIPVGIVLNLLSVVSVTPGNFGFRELILAGVSPLLALDFGVIVQASTCYIFFRLVVSLAVATLFRKYATAKLR